MAGEDGGGVGLSVCSFLLDHLHVPPSQLSHLRDIAHASRLHSNFFAMPFRDLNWEDFQRDCGFFPAYTDYVFGVDTRPEAADEPGLHPQIYGPPPLPPQRLYGLPPPVQYPAGYDSVRDATQTRLYTTSIPRPASMLRQESSMESLLPTPCPAPRALPTPGPPMALLRPGELATDSSFAFIPQQERMATNKNIIQAWSIVNSDAIPAQKAKAMGYLKNISRMVATKREEVFKREREPGRDYAAVGIPEEGEEEVEREAELWYQRYGSPYHAGLNTTETHQAETEAGRTAEQILTNYEYAIGDISQLPAYVQSRLPQLWTCTEIIALEAPPADPVQTNVHRQAQQYLMGFKQSIPLNGRRWFDMVMDGMLKLRKEGGDPLTVLQTVPGVESTW